MGALAHPVQDPRLGPVQALDLAKGQVEETIR